MYVFPLFLKLFCRFVHPNLESSLNALILRGYLGLDFLMGLFLIKKLIFRERRKVVQFKRDFCVFSTEDRVLSIAVFPMWLSIFLTTKTSDFYHFLVFDFVFHTSIDNFFVAPLEFWMRTDGKSFLCDLLCRTSYES